MDCDVIPQRTVDDNTLQSNEHAWVDATACTDYLKLSNSSFERRKFAVLDIGRPKLSLFLHPTIRELHISCVNIIDDLVEHIPANMERCTPLKNLVLEECNICCHGLEAILSLPTALESLYLGENCHNIRHFEAPIPSNSNHLFIHEPHVTLRALKRQEDSLKSLTYVTPLHYDSRTIHALLSDREGRCAGDGGFSKFRLLEEITLIGHCRAFERCVMSVNSPPKLKRVASKAPRPYFDEVVLGAPDDGTNPTSVLPFLRAPAASIPKCLEQLDVTYTDLLGMSVAAFVRLGNQESFLKDLSKAVSEMGVKLRIFATQYEDLLRYYPPYLYGEKEPSDKLILDSGVVTSDLEA